MIQRQFEFSDGGRCYVESDNEDYIGHFKLKLLEFSLTRLVFDISRRDHPRVELSFALTATEFFETQRIVEIVFGIREPDSNPEDVDAMF